MKTEKIKGRKHHTLECKKCKSIMKIRDDYFKKHSGFCQSCQKLGNHFAKRHGEGKTRLYRIWTGIKQRRYHNKPAVCNEWSVYENFRDWSLKNGYRDELTIDRIDNEKGYSRKNCQWITLAENSGKDKKIFDYDDELKIYKEWQETNISQKEQAIKYKIGRTTVQRIHKKFKSLNNNKKYGGDKKRTSNIKFNTAKIVCS